MKFKRIFCILAAVIITSTWTASVAQKKGGGQSSGTGNGQGNQGGGQGNQGNQSGQSNSGNQPSQPAGITGGSSPIESTMFSYMALAADAEKIARAIQTQLLRRENTW